MKRQLNIRGGRGFTLIELMIALALGLFMLAGVVQVYLSNRENSRFNEALTRVQENGRFALDIMAYDIRMAGYFGCAGSLPQSTTKNHVNNAPGGTFDFLTSPSLTGTDNTGLNGSDTLTVTGALGAPISVVATPSTPAAALLVSTGNDVQQGDIMMVSDCTSADIFQVTNANPSTSGTLGHNTGGSNSPGNATQSLQQPYGPGAQVLSMSRVMYSVEAGYDGQPALIKTENDVRQQIASGVEDIQVLYGEDTNADRLADSFVTADNVTNFNSVVSVRVSMLVRSPENNVLDSPQTIQFNGAPAGGGDLRLRQVFTSTVTVRNRTP